MVKSAGNLRLGGMAGLGMAILLSCGMAFGAKSPSVLHFPPMTENGWDYFDVIKGIRDRAEAHTENSQSKPADAVLIRPDEYEWNRYLKTMMNLPDWVDFALENRTRYEVLDHPWRTSQRFGGGRTDPQIALRSRIRFGLGDGPFRFLFEGQDSRSFLNNDRGDLIDETTTNEWDILQVFVSLTLDNVLGSGMRTDFHFGRMTLDFGKRRLIARNEFLNTNTNTFDGFHWHIGQAQTWLVRAFFVQPVILSETRFDKQNASRSFWGIHAESAHLPLLSLNAYYYGLNDNSQILTTTHRTLSTFGLQLYKDPKPGEIDYELESAWQTGTHGATRIRGVIEHFAHFQHLDVGYTFHLPWSPRFLIHYDYASGDRDPLDSQNGRFDTLFGERRFELSPTGIFGPFFRENISSPGWRVIVHPAKGWRIQLKQRFWYLAQSKDSFGESGLRDPTGGAGNYLGHDLELQVQWAISKNLELDAGYDHWFKGSYFDRLPTTSGLPAGGAKDTDYFYLSMRVRL